MTIILLKEISRTGKRTGIILIKHSLKDLSYKGRILKKIDYTDTTAEKEFCDITFEDNNKTYMVDVNKLNLQNIKYKK